MTRRAEQQPPRLDRDSGGWVNPYAYIPLAPNPSHRTEPVAHDTFTGHSGWIDVTLTARSPVHTSGGVADDRTLTFLDLDGRYVLAGASLKGLIRACFERLTGSCLRIVDLDRRFSRRVTVERHDRALVGTYLFRVDQVHDDGHATLTRLYTYRIPVGRRFANVGPVDLSPHQDGDEVTFDPSENTRGSQNVAKNIGHGEKTGRLKLSDYSNTSTKVHQRVYVATEAKGMTATDVAATYQAAVQASVQEDERRRRDLRGAPGAALPCNRDQDSLKPDRWGSRTPYRPTLTAGAVLWGNHEDPAQVTQLSPSRLHRTPLRSGVVDAVPEGLRPCAHREELCWACRVFGMVEPEKDRHGHEQSFAGHVRVGWGYGPPSEVTSPDTVNLPPLESPKPSFGSFSLLNHSATAPSWDDATLEIGGHRMYWHRASVVSPRQPDPRGKIVQTLPASTEFRCRVSFDNLSDVDLGMLVCAIDPRRLAGEFAGAAHKFGMGKAVGLGSLDAAVNKVTLVDREARYATLDDEFHEADIDEFVAEACGQLDPRERHLVALATVMNLENRPDARYPGHASGDDKGFEWYRGHRGEALALPSQTVAGFQQSPVGHRPANGAPPQGGEGRAPTRQGGPKNKKNKGGRNRDGRGGRGSGGGQQR